MSDKGHNIFVSYKYHDNNVLNIPNRKNIYEPTIVRDYVDILEIEIKKQGNVYYGEHDGEDLSDKGEEYIYDKLKDIIYPTTVTIVLISPKMKEEGRYDKSQWIPWEIYYSLREIPRKNGTSHRNAILAVVLPDRWGNYDYMIDFRQCCPSECRTIDVHKMFTILELNIFNKKDPDKHTCSENCNIYRGHYGYIPVVRWSDFIGDINKAIGPSLYTRDHSEDYDLHIDVNK